MIPSGQAAGDASRPAFTYAPGFRLSLVLDPDGRVRAVTELTGADAPSAEAFLGRSVMEIAGEDEGGAERAAVWADRIAAVQDATHTLHYADPKPGAGAGADPVVDCVVTPIRTADGTLEAILVEVDDHTQRIAAAELARDHQDQLLVAVAMTGWGRYVVDLQDIQLVGDARVAEILGRTVNSDLSSRDQRLDSFFSFVHPDDARRVRQEFEDAVGRTREFASEYRISRPNADGLPEERWVSVVGRIDVDDQGRPSRMVGVLGDVTDRRREEEARLRTQKREAIGTLVGGIAHDFNNVIGAILSNASVARHEIAAGNSPQESVGEIERGAQRAGELVRRMLAHTREEVPIRAPFELGAVTREACDLLRSTLPRSIVVRQSIGTPLPPVVGDASQLHQVVMNLVTNAAQAIGSDYGSIDVLVDRVSLVAPPPGDDVLRPGEYLRLRVHDDGPGMTESVRYRIFDPFFTTKVAEQGTGLGLAAAQTTVRNHRGVIRCETAVGGPTTFTVLLPVDLSRPVPRSEVEQPHTAQSASIVRVLFVDDEPALTRLAERAMPAYGCEAITFTDPDQAAAVFSAAPHDFDGLITDLSMPKTTGFDLTERVRVLRPELPVVLTSGFLSADHRAEAERRGIDAIVPKPCSIEELADALLGLLGRPRVAAGT